MKKQIKAFTLVELIVVITILAILGTIAFISFQGYSKTARDSRRISDISNIRTSLELFLIDRGYYQQPDVVGSGAVYYSGDLLWTQGTVGDNVVINLSRNLQNKPLDPLFDIEYTYSLANTKNEYQLMAIYEGEVSFKNIINSSYAANVYNTKIEGTYNEIFLETPSYIVPVPSIITSEETPFDLEADAEKIKSMVVTNGTNFPKLNIPNTTTQTGGLTGLVLSPFTGSLTKKSTSQDKIDAISAIQVAYISSSLATQDIYKTILNTTEPEILVDRLFLNTYNTVASNEGGSLPETELIIEDDCLSAGWTWVDPSIDVKIGTSNGNGFCISPIYGNWSDVNDGFGAPSWNGWGNSDASGFNFYNGWDASLIGDSGSSKLDLGQTKVLDSETTYSCVPLGSSSYDFIDSDTLVGRMKWLTTTGNTYIEGQSIAWITLTAPPNGHAIPVLYIADCIDGVKDLGTDMTYTHIDGVTDEITYSEYTVNEPLLSELNNGISNITYQNRQKYLTAWTQKRGSHLPSAFSYITSGFSSAANINGDFLTGDERGEYQIACDNGKLGAVTWNGSTQYISGDDDDANEQIWLSAIGIPAPQSFILLFWGSYARYIGGFGCGDQYATGAGFRKGNMAARFIIRP